MLYHVLLNGLAYAITVVVQVSFVYYLSQVTIHDDEGNEVEVCGQGDRFLQIICVSVYVAKTFADVWETWEMHLFVWYIPGWDELRDRPILTMDRIATTRFPLQQYTKQTTPSGLPEELQFTENVV